MCSLNAAIINEVIKKSTSWKSLLVSFNHKIRPNEFVCYSFAFKKTEVRARIVESMCGSFLNVVESYEDEIAEYTGMNPKGSVDYLSVKTGILNEIWTSFVRSISVADDNTPLSDIKARAYA